MHFTRQLLGGIFSALDGEELPWTRMELTPAPVSTWSPMDLDPLRLIGRHGQLDVADPTLLAVLSGLQVPEHLPPPDVLALRRLGVGRIPATLMHRIGGPFDLLAPDQADTHESPPLPCLLTLTGINGDLHTSLIRGSLPMLNRWSGEPHWQRHACDWRVAPWRDGPAGRLRLSGGLRVGQRSIPHARLRALRPGDAILIPSKDGYASTDTHLLVGSALMRVCQRSGDSYVFQGWGPSGPHLSNPSHVKTNEKVSSTMDALKVDLDFIVGRLSMTVAELGALAPGQILPLEVATPPRVRIVAHGTQLGSGELIDIEGRLAVEIVEWGDRS